MDRSRRHIGDREALVQNYSHLQNFPRADEALFRLKKIASFVKPIMRDRGWRLPLLAEFWPSQANLLGINEDMGRRICLRLRYAEDKNQFLPFEQTADTMLHELSHNVHGPHDDKFNAMWNQLRSEAEDLIMKGYSGEGFLGKGRAVGATSRRRLPAPQVLARGRQPAPPAQGGGGIVAALGRRLGGQVASPRDDIRGVIAQAAEARATAKNKKPSSSGKNPASRTPTWFRGHSPGRATPTPRGGGGGGGSSSSSSSSSSTSPTGCGNVGHSDREIIEIVDDAVSHGFKTKAEEDEANDAAIARALADEFAMEAEPLPTYAASQWPCPRCTLLNPAGCPKCQACDGPGPT